MSLKRVPVGRVKGLAEVEQKGWKSTVGQSEANGEIRGHRCMCLSCQCEYVCVYLCMCVHTLGQKKKMFMLPSPDQNLKIGSVGQDFFFFFFYVP